MWQRERLPQSGPGSLEQNRHEIAGQRKFAGPASTRSLTVLARGVIATGEGPILNPLWGCFTVTAATFFGSGTVYLRVVLNQ